LANITYYPGFSAGPVINKKEPSVVGMISSLMYVLRLQFRIKHLNATKYLLTSFPVINYCPGVKQRGKSYHGEYMALNIGQAAAL
jgi:hypothetical protein